MSLEMAGIGFGNMVAKHRVVAITRADSAPIRRLIQGAARAGRLVDATNGRRTRAVLVTDSNHVILSHIHPGTIGQKLTGAMVEEIEEPEASEDEGR